MQMTAKCTWVTYKKWLRRFVWQRRDQRGRSVSRPPGTCEEIETMRISGLTLLETHHAITSAAWCIIIIIITRA